MPDVFLSYSREDQATARRVAEALGREGLTVWWDQSLKPGEAFDEVTERALAEARAVAVLWSKSSVESRWVRAEATQAQSSNRLVPAMIEPCRRPIMFELTHTAELTGWNGDLEAPAWKDFLGGVRRLLQPDAGAGSPPVRQVAGTLASRGPRRGTVAIVVVAIVVPMLAVGAWLFNRPGRQQAVAATVQQLPATAPSIAVLPFANLTPDPEQEYFSDGLTEEILNELAQLEGLRVIGRTSSFAFKGRNEDLRKIGDTLGVNHILEGSVRKSGDRVRITAQLISPVDGSHLWSQIYERKLDDIFAIQEEIARMVAAALRVKLAGNDQQDGGTRNFAAYDAFLAGRAGLNSNSQDHDIVTAHLRRAVELDPGYLNAWIWLIDAYTRRLFDQGAYASILARQNAAIDRVMALAPDTRLAQLALSYRALVRQDLPESERLLKASLDAPSGLGVRARMRYGQFLVATGRIRDAVGVLEQARDADPLDVFSRLQIVLAYEIAGDFMQAARERDALLKLPGGDAPIVRAQVLALAMAQADRATLIRELGDRGSPEAAVDQVLLRHRDNLNAALPELRSLLQDGKTGSDAYVLVSLASWAGFLGAPDLSLQALQRLSSLGMSYETWAFVLWRGALRQTRRDPGFRALLRQLQLPDYWRSAGTWGEFCKPLGNDDFECR